MIGRALVLGSLLPAVVWMAVVGPRTAWPQTAEPEGGVEAAPLKFRRIYVPANRLEDLPRDHDRLVPMPAEEFDRLASAIEPAGAAPGIAAGVLSARYEARLEGDKLVDGKATLEIFHSAPDEVLLPLAPLGLAVSEATWLGAEPRPAVLGLADDGRLAVLVSRQGRLRLDWSLAGEKEEAGGVEFQVALPVCGAVQLVLDLPAGVTPVVEQAVVTRLAATESERARWRIELKSRQRTRLRIVPDSQLAAGPQWTRLRQSLVYDFSLRGVEVSAELQLDAYGEPLERLALELGPGMQLATAQYGSSPVPYSIASTGGKGGPTRVVLQLPEPIQGTGRVLRLTGWVPLVLDRPWVLPGIRAEEVFWQEGTASLLVPNPLALGEMTVHEGRQSKTGSLSGSRSGQRIEVQYFSPDGSLDVVLTRPKTPIDVAQGVAVVLGGQQMSARVIAALKLAEGERFELAAGVGRRWIVDTVETTPADALDDWTIQRSGMARTLRIRLAKPLSTARPIRLDIRARWLDVPLARGFTAADLAPLRFHDAEDSRRLIAVRAAEPFQLRIAEEGPTSRVDPQSLGADGLALFGEPPQAPLFAMAQNHASWQVFLEPQKPAYSATIRVDASVSEGVLRESYQINCAPKGARLERLQVEFSHARHQPLEWSIGANGKDQLKASRQTGDASVPAGGEVWQIELTPPRSVPFEIRASRAMELDQTEPVSLVSLPEASQQQGTVVVESSGRAGLRVDNRRLVPIATEPATGDRVTPERARFRYVPTADAAPSDEAALAVTCQPPGESPAPAWAWSCQLHSWLKPDGTGRHLAVYHLETSGQDELRLRLPPGASLDTVHGVWVDRARAAWRPYREGHGVVAVALPEAERYPVVAIQFETAGPRLGWIDTIDAALPMVDVPILARRWTVWLPPGYRWRDPDPRWLLVPAPETSWTERLFGPLGRPAGQTPFDPARLDDFTRWLAPPEAAAAAPSDDSPEEEARGPWAESDVGQLAAADTSGWNLYDLEVPLGEPARLEVARRDTLRAIGLAVLFGVLALAWWLAIERPAVLVALVGVFGVTALVLPETFGGLGSYVVLGLLMCLGFRLVRRRREPVPPLDSGSAERSSLIRAGAQVGLLALAIALTLAMCASANGQQPAEPAEKPAERPPTPVYNVFVPVDGSDRPTGDAVQVPETLYNELYRRASAKADGPQGWLLLGAVYRGTLSWQPGGERLALDRLTATFDIRTLGKRSSVAIPLGGEAVQLATEGALLDGRPVKPRWIEQGGLLAVDIEDDRPQHQLEVPLRPTVQSDGSRMGFDLRIPRWAGSRLELSVPSDAPQVEVPSSLGPVDRQSDPEQIVAQLGPGDRLAVHWPERGSRAASGPAVEVDELLWLKIRDGSVVLDARFRFTPTQGYLSRLELAADSRLRLLPQETPDPTIGSIETTPTQPQTIRFELSQPTIEPVVLSASFLLREASGVGSLRLPLLEARGAHVAKRWLAVWTDPSLDVEHEEIPETLKPLASGEFEANWGPTELRSREAYSLPTEGDTAWSINTRPLGPKTNAEETLALGFDEDEAQVDFSAALATSGGYVFRYRVAAPAGLEVDAVSLESDGTEQVARWARASDNTLTVFLSGPVGGDQTLRLRGRLPVDKDRPMPLPIVHLEGMESETGTISLFRRPSVTLDVARSEGLTDVESPPADPALAALGQPVRTLQFDDADAINAAIKVSENRPKVNAEQTTRLRFDGEKWEAEVDLSLHVRQGLLDEIRLDVPAEFAGPYQLDPPATVERSGTGPAELVVRPAVAIVGDYRLKILSPLEFASGDRVRVPVVRLEEVASTRQVLVLPVQLELEPAVWETKGLEPSPLPDDAAAPALAPESFVAYRVAEPEFEAVLRRSQGVPRVALADVRLACQADGNCFAAVTFILEPAGMSACLLRLPKDFQLIGVSVADVPAAATPAEAGVWKVPLGPPGYPRCVDVLMTGRLADTDPNGRRTLEAPRIEGVATERTLWTVSAPANYRAEPLAGLAPATSLEQTRLRLEQVRQMIERTAEVTSDEKGQADHWYRLWAKRFLQLRGALETQWQQAGRGDSALESWAPLVSTEKLPPPVVAIVDSPEPSPPKAAANPWSDGTDATWLGPWQSRPEPLRCVTEGGSGSLAVSMLSTTARRRWQDWLPAIAVALLAILAVLGIRSGLAGAVFSRWPHLAGVALGLAWWLWLWPSALGWLIVAVSLLASIRSGWKRRRLSGSVIVPLSSVHR